jgi:hypothetical protein
MAEAISIEVQGLTDVKSSLDKIGAGLEDLTDLNKELGSELSKKASVIAPKLTGALSASIGFTATANKAQIYAGNQSVVYAGVQEYGWPEKNIKAQPYLRPAVYDNLKLIVSKYDEYVKDIVKKYDLD